VRARLLNLSREREEEFHGLLTRYALERLLYRLGHAGFRDQFVLKGAMLFSLWSDKPYRPTRDLDLHGRGNSAVAHVEEAFREICRAHVEEDGMQFLPDTVVGTRIREDQEYDGVRVQLTARLAGATIHLQIDIGFGDVITPGPDEVEYPTLLDFPPPRLQAYPRETVIAEKFQAIVNLGIANSRMKDFYDLWVLARSFSFDGELLCAAIRATFARRRTPLPQEPPVALTPAFFQDAAKAAQWTAFLRRARLDAASTALDDMVFALREFLLPPLLALARGESFAMTWAGGQPWRVIQSEEPIPRDL
jgi:predicted nucleotidyltransferase component of viral defense system